MKVFKLFTANPSTLKYISSNYKQKIWLPLKAIKEAVSDDWINSLAYYCLLKKVHKNSLFYCYSLRKVASLIKCSPTTLKYHLEILQSKGLIEIGNGNLIITGTNKLKNIFQSKLIPVKHSPIKSEQITLIRFALIKRNLAYQKVGFEFKNKALTFLKTGKCKGVKPKALKQQIAGQTVQTLERFKNSKFILSNKSFGELVNRSKYTGKKLQAQMNKLKLIKSSKNVVKIDNIGLLDRRGFFEMNLPSKCFLSATGESFIRLPNTITLKRSNSSRHQIGQ